MAEENAQEQKQAKAGKSARGWAIYFLAKNDNRMAFGDLTGKVAAKLEKQAGKEPGTLGWTPTYYLKGPGFSKPERGVIAYDPKEAAEFAANRELEREAAAAARAEKKATEKAADKKAAQKKKKSRISVGKKGEKVHVAKKQNRQASPVSENDSERAKDSGMAVEAADDEDEDEEEA